MSREEVAFFGQTDTGRVRTNNEDAFVVRYLWDEQHVLAVVIDGLGGYEGGEIAAGIARTEVEAYLERYPDGERVQLLKQAVVWANNRILEERRNRPEAPRMGCVLTAVLVELGERRVNMAHVGDTRLYQYVEGRLGKLSHDMSLVGYQEEKGFLTEEEAMNHPQRNLIDRDLGSCSLDAADEEYIETAVFPLLPDSQLLLCSDGLCDMVTSARMAEVLAGQATVEQKVATLVEAANAAGGKDNVTVVLLQFSNGGVERLVSTADAADEVFVDDRVSVTEELPDTVPVWRQMDWTGTLLAVLLVGVSVVYSWWMES